MEDASKALLIAAGMFFVILILTALVMFYDQVSSFYNVKHEENVIKQTQKFNAQFENYNRKNLRGSELISFMNKVIDYNESQSYEDIKSYDRILVTINMGNDNILTNDFIFSKNSSSRNTKLKSTIKNWENKSLENSYSIEKRRTLDLDLVDLTSTSDTLCEELETLGVTNSSDAKLQLLSSKIDYIVLSTTAESVQSNKIKRIEIINDILGTNFTVNDTSKIDKIKVISDKYYQYTQFKRAMFDCINVRYNPETNRIVEMEFNLQIKNGKAIFD